MQILKYLIRYQLHQNEVKESRFGFTSPNVRCVFSNKQKSYKCDNQLITWWTGITRPAGSWNLVTLKTNFAQYKNFVWLSVSKQKSFVYWPNFQWRFWYIVLVTATRSNPPLWWTITGVRNMWKHAIYDSHFLQHAQLPT